MARGVGGGEAARPRDAVPPVWSVLTRTTHRIWTHPENRGRRLRRLGRWAAWQAAERVVRRPWTIDFHGGLRLICRPHDTVTTLALYCGLYDAEEMRFLLAWLRDGDTFVDVGANVAPYSLLATLVPGVRAVAFEPATVARQRAQANVELNGVGDRVTLVARAVGDVDGPARLSADRWATNALVGADHTGPVEEVACTRLDTFDAETGLGKVSLLKVDVEGHELAVLDGAACLLARDRPALVVELNDVAGLRAFAAIHGYVPVRYAPASQAVTRRDWPETPGGNVVLVPDVRAAQRRVAHGPPP
jgi:FkbM family methyltransferase